MAHLQKIESELREDELEQRRIAAERIQSHYRGHKFRLKFKAQVSAGHQQYRTLCRYG